MSSSRSKNLLRSWRSQIVFLAMGALFVSRALASELVPMDNTYDDLPSPATAAVPAQKSAVEDITGKSTFFNDLFSHGSPLHWGLTVGETFDDNIFISHDKVSDFITHISPSVSFIQGDKTAANNNYVAFVFRPTFFFYAENPGETRTDYYADLFYQHQFTRLTLSLDQRYEKLTDPSIDIGNFFNRDIYTTSLNGNYFYDDHLSIAGSQTQKISSFQNQGISATSEWITDVYATYQFAPKLSLGIGPRIGFADIEGAPNQTYQDLLLRLIYEISEKVSLTLDGGAEYRQFQDSAPSRLFPIFDITAAYMPFDGTRISLSGFRQEVISYSEIGDNYLNTVIQGNLKQRFLRNFYFLASAGYNISDYNAASQNNQGAKRHDDYYFLNAGVEWAPRDWITVSARYQYSEDQSSFVENSFTDNQFDIQTSLQF